MRRLALAAIAAAGLVMPLTSLANESAPGSENAGDTVYAFVEDNSRYTNPYYSLTAKINTMGRIDCSKPIQITIRIERRHRMSSWSVDPAFCPESSYRVRTIRDLRDTSTWSSSAEITVDYPAPKATDGKRDKGSKGDRREDQATTSPLMITVHQDRHQYDNEDDCTNVGVIGEPLTCNTSVGGGKG